MHTYGPTPHGGRFEYFNAIPRSLAHCARDTQVYFHVIHANDTLEGGNISDVQIAQQIKIIEEAFFRTYAFGRVEITVSYLDRLGGSPVLPPQPRWFLTAIYSPAYTQRGLVR